MIDWLSLNGAQIVFPILAFAGTLLIGLLLRRMLFAVFVFWVARRKWEGARIVLAAARGPFLFWFVLLGVNIAIQVSVLSATWKGIGSHAVGSLFVLSFAWVVATLAERLLRMYLPSVDVPESAIALLCNAIRSIAVIIAVLSALDIWGVPTTPILVLLLLAAVIAYLLFRSMLPNFFAALQLNANPHFAVGDYVKVDSGEEGYVEEISWNATRIRLLDGSFVAIPNGRLLSHTVVNYGRPLKQAKQPFRFQSRSHLSELTGLQAKDIGEFLPLLKSAPDAVVYYHTHHFLEEHHYLTPEPANDFAVWVTDALGDDVLGEQLASVDTYSFSTLSELKDRLVGIIEEHVGPGPDHHREAEPGREFYFMKSVSVIMGTPYEVEDLREFVEALRKVSLRSLYFHMFEARLRLGHGLNDFSVWLQDSLDEADLGQDIARLDPYNYNLEGLRSALIQLIEKRIK